MKRQMKQVLGLSLFAAGCMAVGMGLSHGWGALAEEERPVVVDAKGLDRLPPIAEVAEKLNPTVVSITNTTFVKGRRFEHPQVGGQDFFDFFFGPGGAQPRRSPQGGAQDEQRQVNGGSGVIISPQGEILTNYHVIAGPEGGADGTVEVKTNDGKTYKATVLGKDKELDIALIKIDAAHQPFAKLGDSDALRIGEWVVAIGNPLGLEHTVTQGIISAKGRKLDTGVSSFLQTDAAINRGNSGGPLLNLRGEVVGINTAINPAGQNIGFAVPISMVNRILKDLRGGRPVSRGYLGVGPQALDQAYQDALGVKEGVVVSTVEKGQAGDEGPSEVKVRERRCGAEAVAALGPLVDEIAAVKTDMRDRPLEDVVIDPGRLAAAVEPGQRGEEVGAQVVGRAVARGRCEVAGGLVAPGVVERVLGDR